MVTFFWEFRRKPVCVHKKQQNVPKQETNKRDSEVKGTFFSKGIRHYGLNSQFRPNFLAKE